MLELSFTFSNWIELPTLFLLVEVPGRKIESSFVLWRFFLLKFWFIFINLLSNPAWCTVVKEISFNLRNGLIIWERLLLERFSFSEHVKCGIKYRFSSNKVCLFLNLKLIQKHQEILVASGWSPNIASTILSEFNRID